MKCKHCGNTEGAIGLEEHIFDLVIDWQNGDSTMEMGTQERIEELLLSPNIEKVSVFYVHILTLEEAIQRFHQGLDVDKIWFSSTDTVSSEIEELEDFEDEWACEYGYFEKIGVYASKR